MIGAAEYVAERSEALGRIERGEYPLPIVFTEENGELHARLEWAVGMDLRDGDRAKAERVLARSIKFALLSWITRETPPDDNSLEPL